MGGNAIKTVPIRRFSKEEYTALAAEVKEKLESDYEFLSVRWHIIDSYSEKETFGDMDILISRPAKVKWKWNGEAFTRMFPSKEVHNNGDVTSLEYKGFQIDFIQCPHEEYEFSKTYFAWNDLGNLIGKTARQLGLKYGHQGLVYTIRDGLGDKLGEITVTLDPKLALEFLGYDWARYQKGFNNLEEIFEYVVSSKHFNADLYLLENLNSVDRVRDKKRATYTAFLEWIKDKNLPRDSTKLVSNWYVPEIRKAFPEFSMQYDLKQAKLRKTTLAKEIFNGHRVASVTGLQKEELGAFMLKFRTWFKSEDDMFDYILHMGEWGIEEAIRTFQKLSTSA